MAVCSNPQAVSSAVGSQRTISVEIFLNGGISFPGFMNEPCKCCAPRSMTLVSADDPQILQLFLYVRCILPLSKQLIYALTRPDFQSVSGRRQNAPVAYLFILSFSSQYASVSEMVCEIDISGSHPV